MVARAASAAFDGLTSVSIFLLDALLSARSVLRSSTTFDITLPDSITFEQAPLTLVSYRRESADL